MVSSGSDPSYLSGMFNQGGLVGANSSVTQLPKISQLAQTSSVVPSEAASESWVQSLKPSRQTMGLFGVLACGLTLIGATTYFVTTRLLKKQRQKVL